MKTLNELNPVLTTGAYLIYVRSHGFLARGIHFFMRLYALRYGRIYRKPVNHADIMVDGIVCGAQYPVSIAQPFEKYYNDGSSRTLYIYRLETGYPSDVCKNVMLLKAQGLPYDVLNLWDFIAKLFTGKWMGHTKHFAEKKVYCIELAHMIMRWFKCKKLMDKSDWDNDPEQSRQWAIDNLELVGEYSI
jgi:hypothetical protein